jgi:hypothetical protein
MIFLLKGRVVTPHVTKTLIKSLKMQLSLKAGANQVIEVGNQNSKSGVQNSEIQVLFSVDRLPQTNNLGNYWSRIRPYSQKRNCSPWLVLQVCKSKKIMEVIKYLF